ncbi:unnamed protein product [Allacma fusca]|uniref:Cytochrome P450 n=1 Tax=Allacma fusca TaxID=39272 RepID=A0A8J2JVR1_9HEXA|nr:unnamed protein product [Allacma fusca]
MFLYFCAALLAAISIYCSHFYKYPHPRFPRGYIGLPVIGFLYYFIFQNNFIPMLVKLKEIYGDICSVQLGSYKVVMLNEHNVIREAWQHPAFAGRSKLEGVLVRSSGFRGGIIFNDGEDLLEQQKFTKKTLKDFGFGRKSMENLILEEALELVQSFRETNSKPVYTGHRFDIASLNSFYVVVTGERLKYDDPTIHQLIHVLNKNFELSDGAIIGFLIPWLAWLCPHLIGWNKYVLEVQEIFSFWLNFAQHRLETFSGSYPENFVDAYIQRIVETKDPSSSFYGDIGVKSLATTLQDIFVAGTETTAATLNWIFFLLAAHPEVQKKVFNEINTVLGSGDDKTLPTISDRLRLPMVEAAIMESMRLGTIAPIGLAHRTMEDIHFRGHFIPKDTLIHSNIISVHFDVKLWGDPYVFRPERFLTADTSKIQNFRYFLPFSHGKRKCLGESLAKDELFLFTTCMLQEFRIKIPAGNKILLRPRIGISAVPQNHQLVFEPRN